MTPAFDPTTIPDPDETMERNRREQDHEDRQSLDKWLKSAVERLTRYNGQPIEIGVYPKRSPWLTPYMIEQLGSVAVHDIPRFLERVADAFSASRWECTFDKVNPEAFATVRFTPRPRNPSPEAAQ